VGKGGTNALFGVEALAVARATPVSPCRDAARMACMCITPRTPVFGASHGPRTGPAGGWTRWQSKTVAGLAVEEGTGSCNGQACQSIGENKPLRSARSSLRRSPRAMTSELPVEEHNYRTASAGLASACERGDEEEVQFLLHAGVDVDTRFEVSGAVGPHPRLDPFSFHAASHWRPRAPLHCDPL
jgi:hypothetical protein